MQRQSKAKIITIKHSLVMKRSEWIVGNTRSDCRFNNTADGMQISNMDILNRWGCQSWERLMDGPMKAGHVDWSIRRPGDVKCWLKFTCYSLFLWLTFIRLIIPLPFKTSITRLWFLFLAPHFITEIHHRACSGRSAASIISHGYTADILQLIKIFFYILKELPGFDF